MGMKWIGIAGLILAVSAIGLYFTQSGDQEPDAVTTPPESAPAKTDSEAPEEAATTATDCPAPMQSGSGSNQAGLLVTFGDGTSQSVCVSFSDPTISAYQLLVDSGLGLITQDYGGNLGQALCKVSSGRQSEGCDYPNENCFCDRAQTWVLFEADASQTTWAASQQGISVATVGNGGVLAQLWGNTQSQPSPLPPACFLQDIC